MMESDQELDARRETTKRLIADLRRRLLDLRNSNRLLNFKFSDRSRTHVRVIDEVPDVLYRKLVDSKKLIFSALPHPEDELDDEKSDKFLMELQAARLSDEGYLRESGELGEEDEASAKAQRIERALKDRVRLKLGLPSRPTRETMTPAEYARANGFDPTYDLPRCGEGSESKPAHTDDHIQTLLFPDQMDRKLSGIFNGARIALSEMGVNILFAAFGYLEWYESEVTDSKFFAPLLLHPLDMQRTLFNHVYRYSVTSTGDDSETNLTLKERLLSEFHLALPDFLEDDTPDSYFVKVEQAIRDMHRWRVRRFVTVGLFAFGRLVMYHDLDPERWPQDGPLHFHPVLVDLLGGSTKGDAVFPEEYEVDRPEIAAKVPVLIHEADASQFACIAEVMDGRNLAIKGPPGTGKSQTITNLIAAALAKKLTVLFVAEKMAALEVVKKRLDDAGLADFCLELHSTKSRKRDVLESLRRRLDGRPTAEPGAIRQTTEEHQRLRDQLSSYVELINRPVGKSGRSLHQLLWAGARASLNAKELGLPIALHAVVIEDALNLTAVDVDRRTKTLVALEELNTSHVATYGALEDHPWAGVSRADLSPFGQEELVRAMEAWRDATVALDEQAKRAESEFRIRAPASLEETRRLTRAASHVPVHAEGLALEVLTKLGDRDALVALKKFVERVDASREVLGYLSDRVEEPLTRLPDAEQVRTLAAECHQLKLNGDTFTGSVEKLSTVADRHREHGRLTEAQISIAKRLFQAADFSSALTVSALRVLLRALDMLRATPREVLLMRSTNLIEEAGRPILENAANEAQALRTRQERIADVFSFSLDDHPLTYRLAAAELRSANLFERLIGRDYRRARRLWRRVRKVRTRATPHQMAKELDELAEHLREVRKFQSDNRLIRLCGAEFMGLDTNLDLLLAVNDFGRKVRHGFPGSSLADCEARRLLLQEMEGRLEGFLAEANESEISGLCSVLATLETAEMTADDEIELTSIHRAYLDKASQLQELYLAIRDIGIKSEMETAELHSLANKIADFTDLQRAVECDERMRNLLGLRFHGTFTDVEALARSADIASRLHAEALPQGLLDRLLAVDVVQDGAGIRQLCGAIEVALERYNQAFQRAHAAGEINVRVFLDARRLDDVSFSDSTARIRLALDNVHSLPSLIEYNRVWSQAQDMGLGPILHAYQAARVPLKHLKVALEHVLSRTILKEAYQRFPDLARFSGANHEVALRRFQELDRKIIELNRSSLTADLSRVQIPWGVSLGPRRGWTERHLIENEISKKQRHTPCGICSSAPAPPFSG